MPFPLFPFDVDYKYEWTGGGGGSGGGVLLYRNLFSEMFADVNGEERGQRGNGGGIKRV